MKIILTFTLMMIPGVVSSISVTGYSGGEVNITCKYDEEYTAYIKYFCGGQWFTTCSDLIKTNIKDKWFQNGSLSLYDDTRSAVFIVTIRNLRELDSGKYWCGIERFGIDLNTEVNLKVIRETPPSPPPSSPPSSSSSSASSFSSVRPSPFTGASRSSASLASLNTSAGSSLIVPLLLVLLVLIIAGL